MDKLTALDNEVKGLRQEVQKFSKEVTAALAKLEQRLSGLTMAPSTGAAGGDAKAKEETKKPAAPAKDDDDIDLFGSDEEDPEAERLREERAAVSNAKKAKKPALVAKSMIILDVKPWDDETDLKEMEVKVRSIEADGLLWGTSKQVPIAFGIKKLQITCVVEDDKISTDWLEEQICGFEDYVQSIDIAAFNKI